MPNKWDLHGDKPCWEPQPSKNGKQLSQLSQQQALEVYLSRYTGSHTPDWVKMREGCSEVIELQFVDDNEWLTNTEFFVDDNGELDTNRDMCFSIPTWPNKPKENKDSPTLILDKFFLYSERLLYVLIFLWLVAVSYLSTQ